jgi:hypothetical protein
MPALRTSPAGNCCCGPRSLAKTPRSACAASTIVIETKIRVFQHNRRVAVDPDRDGAAAVRGEAIIGLPDPNVCWPIKLANIPGSTRWRSHQNSAFARTRHVRRVFSENTVLVAGPPRLPGSTSPLDLCVGDLKLNQALVRVEGD